MDTIDKIYIINLDERLDRFKKIEKELKSIGIDNYVRFPAIKPDPNDYPYEISTHKFGSKDPNYVRGSLGCKLSHLAVLENAQYNKYKRILILEDDIEFIGDDGKCRMVDAFKVLDSQAKDFILLYLSANLFRAKLKSFSFGLSVINNALCAHSYVVNCQHLDTLIKGIKSSKHEVDVYYKEVQQSNKCFILTPGITRQRAGYSNIMERKVSYDTIG